MQLKSDNYPGGETMRFFPHCSIHIICKYRLETMTTSTFSKNGISKKKKRRKVLLEN